MMFYTAVADENSLKPRWTLAVQFRDEFLRDKISAFSVGFRPINNNTVELVGSESNKIDGARWSRGFSSGRHVIEFIYPVHLRAAGARVGLGTKDTILGGNDVTAIVGGQGSLAIDLVTRKVMHNNAVVKRFPAKEVNHHKSSSVKFIKRSRDFMYQLSMVSCNTPVLT